jgi:DNA-binding NtrC family response regulator
MIRLEDLPDAVIDSHTVVAAASAPPLAFHEGVREAKKQLITQAVAAARGKYTEAARLLGLHPNYLHMLIRNLDMKDSLKK